MRLYATLFRISLQDATQYRVESAIWFLYEIVPPLMMAAVWIAAYQDQTTVAGFSLAEMLAYTVGVMILRTLITVHLEHGIDIEIRRGDLSNHLVRPFNIWAFWFVDSIGWKMFRNALSIPVVLGCLFWFGSELGPLSVPLERLPLLLISVLLGAVVCFFLKLCLGFTSFWTNDIIGTATLYEVVATILGGMLIPIALLPEGLQTVARLLPIQAIYSVPLSILLGKSDGPSAWYGILLQVGWIVVLWALALVLWRAGLRQYESVGR
jgi:viologen exporter family transport system permease protein